MKDTVKEFMCGKANHTHQKRETANTFARWYMANHPFTVEHFVLVNTEDKTWSVVYTLDRARAAAHTGMCDEIWQAIPTTDGGILRRRGM